MSKTILICGYGPGISNAVAEKFGAEGFAVGLVARTADRLASAVKALEKKGVRAAGFPADVGDPAAVAAVVAKARGALGPITVLEWNAYPRGGGDLVTANPEEARGALDVAVVGLLAGVQAALPDLRQESDAAVLVVNGGLGYFDATVDAMAVDWNAMGLAVANAAKHKLVRVLHHRLKKERVYVGEAMVLGLVKGTAFDTGQATIEASTVADVLWKLYRGRSEVSTPVR